MYGLLGPKVIDIMGGVNSLQIHGFYRVPFSRPSLRACMLSITRREAGATPDFYTWDYADVIEVLEMEPCGDFTLPRNTMSGAVERLGNPELLRDYGRGSVELSREERGLKSSKAAFEPLDKRANHGCDASDAFVSDIFEDYDLESYEESEGKGEVRACESRGSSPHHIGT